MPTKKGRAGAAETKSKTDAARRKACAAKYEEGMVPGTIWTVRRGPHRKKEVLVMDVRKRGVSVLALTDMNINVVRNEFSQYIMEKSMDRTGDTEHIQWSLPQRLILDCDNLHSKSNNVVSRSDTAKMRSILKQVESASQSGGVAAAEHGSLVRDIQDRIQEDMAKISFFVSDRKARTLVENMDEDARKAVQNLIYGGGLPVSLALMGSVWQGLQRWTQWNGRSVDARTTRRFVREVRAASDLIGGVFSKLPKTRKPITMFTVVDGRITDLRSARRGARVRGLAGQFVVLWPDENSALDMAGPSGGSGTFVAVDIPANSRLLVVSSEGDMEDDVPVPVAILPMQSVFTVKARGVVGGVAVVHLAYDPARKETALKPGAMCPPYATRDATTLECMRILDTPVPGGRARRGPDPALRNLAPTRGARPRTAPARQGELPARLTAGFPSARERNQEVRALRAKIANNRALLVQTLFVNLLGATNMSWDNALQAITRVENILQNYGLSLLSSNRRGTGIKDRAAHAIDEMKYGFMAIPGVREAERGWRRLRGQETSEEKRELEAQESGIRRRRGSGERPVSAGDVEGDRGPLASVDRNRRAERAYRAKRIAQAEAAARAGQRQKRVRGRRI